jgi:hypothetical protein
MENSTRRSVTPFFSGALDQTRLPVEIDAVKAEFIQGLFQSEAFSLWSHYVANNTLEFITGANVGLVHRYSTEYGIGKSDEDSKDLLYKLFVCMRLVKPTRIPFSVVQYRDTKKGIDIISFMPPVDAGTLNLPNSEILNRITMGDLTQLRKLWPAFRKVRDCGPGHLRRATRYYETGYASLKEPDLQFLAWMMGIEALYSDGDVPRPGKVIKERLLESIGRKADIYQDVEAPYRPEPIEVQRILDEMFQLRNRLVHGAWAPVPWLQKIIRKDISGAAVALPDVLREAASFILRTGLKKTLSRGI